MELSKEPKILLVDDNYVNQKLASITLKHLNFKCDLASDGNQAFEMYKQNRYDLIFMDIQMPFMNGWEATEAIRNFERSSGIEKGAYIVALTASDASDVEDKFQAAGMDTFITKPLRTGLLSELLNKFR